ncbi:MAG: hypothetical protein ABL895_17060 [Cyclobacteriaceae bacterium]
MGSISDTKLKSLLQEKLSNYESDPSPRSWERIQNDLPQTGVSGIRSSTVKFALVVVVLTFLNGVVQKYYKNLPAPSTTHSPQSAFLTDSSSHNKKLWDPPKQMATSSIKDIAVDQAPRFDSSFVKYSTSGVGASHFSAGTQDLVLVNVLLKETYILENNEVDADSLGSSDKEINIFTDQFTPIKPLPGESFDLNKVFEFQDSISEIDVHSRHIPNNRLDSLSSYTTHSQLSRGHWIAKFAPLYMTGVFIPLTRDNILVSNYVQSPNILKNRLGLTLEFGYHHMLSKKNQLEYTIGYKVFSKDIVYTTTFLSAERNTEVLTSRISGVNHLIKIGASLRSLMFSRNYPMLVSFSYEKGLGPITAHGGSIINYGFGFETSIAARWSLRPMVSYGIPQLKHVEHFAFRPIGWSIEVVWKLSQKKGK